MILDIFSRYVTGWMLARRESAELARRLISESCLKQNIEADQLTIHADRGSSMRSKSVALLLADLGITKRCLRCLLLVMCTHPFAKKALTLHLARSEGHERYFGCNLMHRKV